MRGMSPTLLAKYLVACCITVGLLGVGSYGLAGSKVKVGRSAAPNRRRSMDQIDHRGWDALLKRYVDAAGRVDYRGWKSAQADVRRLDAYLGQLSEADPRIAASQEAKLAFWINAYNAVTVRGILREYPTSSIRNHTARLYGYNIWKDLLLTVGDNSYSLNAIENEVLRKMAEPRIHFAIVCASISCPPLRSEAYTAEKVRRQLADNATAFFANPRNFRCDQRANHLYLSSILKWFGTDFGRGQADQLRAIAPYLPSTARNAATSNAVRVSYLDYDWGLNER